jgi:hypothetical protein
MVGGEGRHDRDTGEHGLVDECSSTAIGVDLEGHRDVA